MTSRHRPVTRSPAWPARAPRWARVAGGVICALLIASGSRTEAHVPIHGAHSARTAPTGVPTVVGAPAEPNVTPSLVPPPSTMRGPPPTAVPMSRTSSEVAPAPPAAAPHPPALGPPPPSAPPPPPPASLGAAILQAETRARRPRFSAAISMGVSLDSSGLVGSRTEPVPAFLAQLGVGEGLLGFELRLFATQASGRYYDRMPTGPSQMDLVDSAADRLAVDLLVALRPWSSRHRDATTWFARAAQSLAVNVGLGVENAGVVQRSALRPGAVVGAHVDFPVASAASGSALRLRLTVRRMFAGEVHVGTTKVADTALEGFAGLAVVF